MKDHIEALDMETPAKVHAFLKQIFPEIIRTFNYAPDMRVMNVTLNGSVRWKSYFWVYIKRISR